MKIHKVANNKYIFDLVKEEINKSPLLLEKDKEDSWWRSTKLYLQRRRDSFSASIDKSLYNNNREQATSNIESSDPDVERIKDFFALFSEVSYDRSRYLSIFNRAWAIEDPGTYFVQDDFSKKLDSWYKTNRSKFLKELQSLKNKNRADQQEILKLSLEIIEEYVEDFCSTFDFYGLRIEKGSRRLTVHPADGMNLMRACIKANPSFLKNIRAQWHGSQPSIIDCFPYLFKFLWNLSSLEAKEKISVDDLEKLIDEQLSVLGPSAGLATALAPDAKTRNAAKKVYLKQAEKLGVHFRTKDSTVLPNIRRVISHSRIAVSKRSFLPVLKKSVKFDYVSFLQNSNKFRKKWTGFCYNMTFDPTSEFDLDYWTSKSQIFKNKSQKTEKDVYVTFAADITALVIAEGAAIKVLSSAAGRLFVSFSARAAVGAGAAAAAAASTPPGWIALLVGGIVIGVSLLIGFDEYLFQWFTVIDEIEDELNSILDDLRKLEKLSTKSGKVEEQMGVGEPFAGPHVGPPGTSLPAVTQSVQVQLNSIRKSINKSAKSLTRYIHDAMEQGLQRNIGGIRSDVESKKILMENLTRIIEIINGSVKNLSFTEGQQKRHEIQNSILIFEDFLKQIKSLSAESSNWDQKVQRDIGIDSVQDVENLEKLYEQMGVGEPHNSPSVSTPSSSDNKETTPDTNTSSDSSSKVDLGKWPVLLKEKYRVDFDSIDSEKDAMAAVIVARRFDRESVDRKSTNLRQRYPEVFNHLDDSDSGSLNEQAAAFINWWQRNARGMGEIIKDPNKTAERTFMHNSWAQLPLGLKSTTGYRAGKFLNKSLQGKSNISAFCGIGLGHAIANTSFYYTAGSIEKIYDPTSKDGYPILDRFYEKSKVNISKDGSISLINSGIYIQKLESLLEQKMDYNSLRTSLKSTINSVSAELKGGQLATNRTEYLKLLAFNILAKLYYYEQLDSFKIVEQIIKLDNKVSDFMYKNAVKLSNLTPEQQNTDLHKKLISSLREAGSYKIMFFQALMNL